MNLKLEKVAKLGFPIWVACKQALAGKRWKGNGEPARIPYNIEEGEKEIEERRRRRLKKEWIRRERKKKKKEYKGRSW